MLKFDLSLSRFYFSCAIRVPSTSWEVASFLPESGYIESRSGGIHFKKWSFEMGHGLALMSADNTSRLLYIPPAETDLRHVHVFDETDGCIIARRDKFSAFPPHGTVDEDIHFFDREMRGLELSFLISPLDGFVFQDVEYESGYDAASDFAVAVIAGSDVIAELFFSPDRKRAAMIRAIIQESELGENAILSLRDLSALLLKATLVAPLSQIVREF